STYDVMGILWKLEQKGVAERGYIETKNTKIDSRGKNFTQTRIQEYFIPTEEGKKLGGGEEQTLALPWHEMDAEFVTSKPHEDSRYKHDKQVQNGKSDIIMKQNTNQDPNSEEGIDFSKLATNQLKAFVTIPKFSRFAKQMLENRRYSVSIKDGKVKLRKKY
ncbi:MAG: hypothetical protein ACREBJ_13100, partial [Nitrosotalea sp.]